MAILVKGTTYTAGAQVTHTNLNALVDSATFDTGAVDNSTTQLSAGAIIVKDGGITTSKLGGDITTAGKALLDDASASAQRTTLGLGSMATNSLSEVEDTATNVTQTGSGTGTALTFTAVGAPTVQLTAGKWLVVGNVTARMTDSAGEAKFEFADGLGANAFGGGASKQLPTTRDCIGIVGYKEVSSGTFDVYFKGTPVAGSTLDFGSATAGVYAGSIVAVKLEGV